MVMPANNTSWLVHYWAGLYGGLGHLYSPSRSEQPFPHLPYALDNGAYSAFTSQTPWNRDLFLRHLERYAFQELRPSWVVVPDVVQDRDRTFENWRVWAPRIRKEYRIPLALAVQDGMEIEEVQDLEIQPDVIFVGGSTEWKWRTFDLWPQAFQRVHVGRVNSGARLKECAAAGIESVDGTGWFRGHLPQILDLGHFLRDQAGIADDGSVDRMASGSRLKKRGQLCLTLEAS